MRNSGRLRFLKFWFPVIAYSGIIFCASSVPNVWTPLQEVQFDKFLHVLEYIPFGFLLAFGIGNMEVSVSRKMFWGIILLTSFLYGTSDEFHQSFVPGRSASVADAVVDTIGGVIGGYVYPFFMGRTKRK